MLQVNIEKILPVTEARDNFNKIVDEVEGTDELYVLTKNGKPAAVVVGVNHLEKLTGEKNDEVMAKVSETTDSNLFANEEVGAPAENPFETGAGFADANPTTSENATLPSDSEEVSPFVTPSTNAESVPEDIQKESEELFFNDVSNNNSDTASTTDQSTEPPASNPFATEQTEAPAVDANPSVAEPVEQNQTPSDDNPDDANGAGPVLPA